MAERKNKIRPNLDLYEGLEQLKQAILSSPSPEVVLEKLLKRVESSTVNRLAYDKQDELSYNNSLHFQELVESLNDWIWKVDEFGVYTYVSPRIKDLLGYEPEEVIGKKPFDLMPQEEAERVSRLFEEFVKKRQPFYALENTNRTRGGDLVVIETSGVPIFDNLGGFCGYQGVDRDITDRKQVEKKLIDSEKNYRLLVENQNELVVKVDADGRFLFVSPTYCQTFGKSEGELLGKSFMPLVHEEDRESTAKAMESLQHPPYTAFIEQRALTVAGWRWLAWSDKAIVDGNGRIEAIIGVGHDITLRKELEAERHATKEKLQNIIETTSEWIWEIDLAGRYTFSNQRILDFLGYQPEEIPELDYYSLLHEDDLKELKQKLPQFIDEQRGWNGWVLRWRHKDGSYRFLESNSKPVFNSAGEHVSYRGTDRDITQRKKSEEVMLAATEAAEAANLTKSVFMAKVSHEIRTPMTAIVGFGELLEGTELTSEQQKYLSLINASSKTLTSLIDDVIDLSKIEAGIMSVKFKNFMLRSLVDKSIATYEQQIAEKNLDFNVCIDRDIPDSLIGDPLRIQQVLLNIIGNAVKFTETGGVSVEISMAEETSKRVLLDIAVKDTGTGIAIEKQEKIFEPFTQALSPDSHNYGGSGLGLAISRSLVSLMGGSLHVESEENVGSCFHILIPLQKQNSCRSQRPLAESENISWTGPALNILLAEDNPINSKFINTVLTNMGHEVTVVENGKLALDALSMKSFHLVLMDIEMPQMDGASALKVIRELEQTSGNHLIVIAMTAYALIGDQDKYLNMGFDGYLSKPLRTKDLFDELVRIVPH